MAERAVDRGASFTVKGFWDEFLAAGVIPVSLIRWELTGRSEQVAALVAER